MGWTCLELRISAIFAVQIRAGQTQAMAGMEYRKALAAEEEMANEAAKNSVLGLLH